MKWKAHTMNLIQNLSPFVSIFICSVIFAQELSSLGKCDFILRENLIVSPNTVYSELGYNFYKTQEERVGFGYGMFFSFWQVHNNLCQLKMCEKSFESRSFAAGTKIKLSGQYEEFEQDGYLVQELIVVEPKDIKSIICYSFCEKYRSLMGLPEKSIRIGISRGYKIKLDDFKSLVDKKIMIEIK